MKNLREISSFYTCIKNHNHTMYGSWEWDRQNFLSFLTIFCPFTPLKNPKNQNFENMKKAHGDTIILHKCTKNHDHMPYCSWDMARDRCNCYFSFWAIFCPFTPLAAQKIKISKNEKNTWKYYQFTHVYQKLWLDDVRFHGAQRTDGQADGKSDI